MAFSYISDGNSDRPKEYTEKFLFPIFKKIRCCDDYY